MISWRAVLIFSSVVARPAWGIGSINLKAVQASYVIQGATSRKGSWKTLLRIPTNQIYLLENKTGLTDTLEVSLRGGELQSHLRNSLQPNETRSGWTLFQTV